MIDWKVPREEPRPRPTTFGDLKMGDTFRFVSMESYDISAIRMKTDENSSVIIKEGLSSAQGLSHYHDTQDRQLLVTLTKVEAKETYERQSNI